MEKSPSTRKTKATNPGVVYMSRLPPFMKPAKIRNIFSQYGEVGRLFLQPEGKKFGYLPFVVKQSSDRPRIDSSVV